MKLHVKLCVNQQQCIHVQRYLLCDAAFDFDELHSLENIDCTSSAQEMSHTKVRVEKRKRKHTLTTILLQCVSPSLENVTIVRAYYFKFEYRKKEMRQLIIVPDYLREYRLYRFKFSNNSHVLMKYFWLGIYTYSFIECQVIVSLKAISAHFSKYYTRF